MRIRHAMFAGSAVALLSAATSLMASASASAQAVQVAVPAPAALGATSSAGSSAGLVLGLLAVIGIAAVSFVVRLSGARTSPRTQQRVITLPEPSIHRLRVPAYAD